ncbi:hypothetical protein PUW24_00900 (plasmid) [Paenibacillus urinalis]|uniref:Uncharacterized protein n=2 Tax=Paenibacillus TaxID=44249 RepID=A0AAX3N8M7_9BACL|nr:MULTISPECIES: hypothetical protein [Paenibacillus]MCM3130528.1 hypothetical protein [Paenibacillus sp. MER 78]WDH85414.1 hypothetical protein PUW23_25595 [Paenibacillus urinalis]WDH95148.1 hypothetical protein PUW24_00900 [Paenibacillus urinalis]WDI05380.1 hypothetical protein PUW25_26675 [Paenibacillus urinalis]
MITTKTQVFEGGTLIVSDVPARKCECEVLTQIPDGVIMEGYKMLLEKNGIVGDVTVSLAKLKEHFTPMDFIRPHIST